jgi:benzoyl-CoA-dihydrodiol lyase
LQVDFQTGPAPYKHWTLAIDGARADLFLDVDCGRQDRRHHPRRANVLDLEVAIELRDALQRLRFEYPEVAVVVVGSGRPDVFCTGFAPDMLAAMSGTLRGHISRFLNEILIDIEDASAQSGTKFICAIRGQAAAAGFELALACDLIVVADWDRTRLSMGQVAEYGQLPDLGGVLRLIDKRRVRRDRADVLCTARDAVPLQRAMAWRLIDAVVPDSYFTAFVHETAEELLQHAGGRVKDRARAAGVRLGPLNRTEHTDRIAYSALRCDIDRARRRATIVVFGPEATPPASAKDLHDEGDRFWPLRLARELDDCLLHLRFNEADIGTWVFKSDGDYGRVLSFDNFLEAVHDDWLVREVRSLWRRVLKRLDVSARTVVALVEPGSCFTGTLAELVLAADRAFMFSGARKGDDRPVATMTLSSLNFGGYPMGNGLTRIESRLFGEPRSIESARATVGMTQDAADCEDLGLVSIALDEVDWDGDVRLFLEERASFSADALTGLEANLRFAGPETMETRIFGRLAAWQNWIISRMSATGPSRTSQHSDGRPNANVAIERA